MGHLAWTQTLPFISILVAFLPQRLNSFWSELRITTSGHTQFSDTVQSSHFIFSANQICQIWCEVHQSWTSSIKPAQRKWFLVLTKRSAASGDKNVLENIRDLCSCHCLHFASLVYAFAERSLRVVYKSRQPAKFASFSARFRRLLSLLHKPRYVEEMMFTSLNYLGSKFAVPIFSENIQKTQGQFKNVMLETIFLNKSCCEGGKVWTIWFVVHHIGFRYMNA